MCSARVYVSCSNQPLLSFIISAAYEKKSSLGSVVTTTVVHPLTLNSDSDSDSDSDGESGRVPARALAKGMYVVV